MADDKGDTERPLPDYSSMDGWSGYSAALMTEYRQCVDEGLDVVKYEGLFRKVSELPPGETREKLADALYDLVCSAKMREDYPYREPDDLEEIRALRPEPPSLPAVDPAALGDKILGAWTGRICGCLLGKTLECIRTDELVPFLKESGNYPMRRYVLSSDVGEEVCRKYRYPFAKAVYADKIDGMPVDDDTNYTVLSQLIVERYGRDFIPRDVAGAWLTYQGRNAYCTAERVAYRNLVNGYTPPASARYKNPYREWIGAQIRGDYYGYINPGDPETAASMAWRDASVSHTKNGIYGEMFAAGMLATAAATRDMPAVIRGGLSQIPRTSRLSAAVERTLCDFEAGRPREETFEKVHRDYDEYTEYGWCHVIPNATIVAASLLWGGGDYGKSICMAVETGFDTDCNGATVGSVVGMAEGASSLPRYWTAPVGDVLHTSISGMADLKISELAEGTMKHIISLEHS